MDSSLVKLEWEAATKLLHRAKRITLVAHVRPDGDAIGSMCGLGLALMEHGKKVTMAVDGGISPYLSFVPGSEHVKSTLNGHPTAPDLVIACDAADFERTGKVGAAVFDLDTPCIVIDHHNTNTLYGHVHIVHSDFVSTTEAVLRWLDYLGWELTTDIATALMVGFMTDTISFRVGPVTAETLHQVQRLVAAGASIRQVTDRMLGQTRFDQLKLMGRGLANMEMEDHVVWTYLRLSDFEEFNLSTGDKPELSSEIIQTDGAYVACFFLETEDGNVRLSMRGKGGFSVGHIAASLGGGGHTLAAGATLPNISLDDAIAKVIPLLKEEARRGTPL